MNNVLVFDPANRGQGENLMERLRYAREKVGISVTDLAKRLNIQPAAYRRYERGEVSPKLDVCQKICNIFNMTLSEVFDEEYVPPAEVDMVGRARPGQTLYIKVVVDEDGGVAIPSEQIKNTG